MLIHNHFLREFDDFLDDPTQNKICNFGACREADTLTFYLPLPLSISRSYFSSLQGVSQTSTTAWAGHGGKGNFSCFAWERGGTHSGLTLILLYGLIPGHRHEMTDSHTLTPLSLATKTVTRMPEFTSSSNMTVVYTYTGGTAHIDCGVNLQGNKFSDSYYWEELHNHW